MMTENAPTDSPLAIPAEPLELFYASLAADEVPAPTADNVRLLQYGADYYSLSAAHQKGAISSLILGGIILALAIAPFRTVPASREVMVLLGIAFLGSGIWKLLRPSPLDVISDAIGWLIAAIWFGQVLLRALNNHHYGDLVVPIIVVSRAYWTVPRWLQRKRDFAIAAEMRPSKALLDWLKQTVTTLRKTKVDKDPSTMTFNSAEFFSAGKVRGKIIGELLFIDRLHPGDMFFAARDEVELVKFKKQKLSSKVRYTLRIGTRTIDVTSAPLSFRRLADWMEPGVAPPP